MHEYIKENASKNDENAPSKQTRNWKKQGKHQQTSGKGLNNPRAQL